MNRRLVKQVLKHLDRGDRVLFGFDHFGAVRIKVKHGPFKMFSTHHRTDQETFNAIQNKIALVGDQTSDKNKIVYNGAPAAPAPSIAAEPVPEPARAPRKTRTKRRKARPFKRNGVRSEPAAVESSGLKLNGVHQANGVVPSHEVNGAEVAPEPPASVSEFPNLGDHLCQKTGEPSEQWTKYSQSYRRRREATERERQENERKRDDSKFLRRIEAEEIESHRFSLVNVDGSWDDLLDGDIPHVAAEVWRGMDHTSSVHKLAEELQVPLRECVFWLCVFKRHLGVWVELNDGCYRFLRPGGEPDLARAIRASQTAEEKGPRFAAE
ncbi:MAG: hypothetical protein AAGI06_14850 [Pseudomonadota bacterium]